MPGEDHRWQEQLAGYMRRVPIGEIEAEDLNCRACLAALENLRSKYAGTVKDIEKRRAAAVEKLKDF